MQPGRPVAPGTRPLTSEIASLPRSMIPGYFASRVMRSFQTLRRLGDSIPSPRYRPSRYAYDCPRERSSVHAVPSGGVARHAMPSVGASGTAGGTRTHKPSRAAEFESALYANSSTAARLSLYRVMTTSMIEQVFTKRRPSPRVTTCGTDGYATDILVAASPRKAGDQRPHNQRSIRALGEASDDWGPVRSSIRAGSAPSDRFVGRLLRSPKTRRAASPTRLP